MKKTAFALILFVLYAFKTSAQSNPNLYIDIATSQFQAKQVIPPSPNAAELGKYGNVPVSLFTGTPSISIPLYELKGSLLRLPITLTYSAAGFKPGDLPTWVGSGWSLDAGGVITRSVLGNPDTQTDYFNSTNPTAPPVATDVLHFYNYAKNVQQGNYESQPDVYYYNFAGHTGKFVLRPDQSVVKKKRDMMKIVSNNILVTGGGSFTITDEDGVIYTFADVENSLTIPNDDPGAGIGYNYPSAWFLTKIQSADGLEEMDFSYYTTTNSQQLYANPQENQSYTYQHYTHEVPYCVPNSWGESQNSYTQIPPSNAIQRKFLNKITLKRNGTIVSYVNLSSTKTRQDSPDFPEDRLLNQVYVHNVLAPDTGIVKQYNLTYSYFTNANNPISKKRLRLDAVQQIAVDGVTTSPPPYQFTYNYTDSIPDRYTANLDHWGFFNNAGNTSMVPTMAFQDPASSTIIYVGGNANREPDFNGTLCTMLTKMQYPTGGYTTFEYELNQGFDQVIRSIGGLRIKTMTDYSITGVKATTKQYTYTLDDGTPSGSIINYPQYFLQSSLYEYGNPELPLDQCGQQDRPSVINTISANSIIGLGSIQGSHIGYKQVTETQVDNVSGQPLGKTIYKYNAGSKNAYDDDAAAGDLLSQADYRADGKLLNLTTNTYITSVPDFVPAYLIKTQLNQNNKADFCMISDGEYYNYGTWEDPPADCTNFVSAPTKLYAENWGFRSMDDKLIGKTDTSYDPDNNIYRTFSSVYSYDNPAHIYPTRITQSSVNNTQVVTSKKYAADFTFTGSSTDPSALGIKQLNAINMPGTEIETTQYRQNADGSNLRYINGMISTFSPGIIPTPTQVLRIETVKPLTAITSSTINTSGVFTYDPNYKLAGTFKYSAENNLIEQSKAAGPVTSYIWDYNTLYPIAAVSNATSNAIAFTSFEVPTSGSNWILTSVGTNTTTAFSGRQSATLATGGKISKLFAVTPAQLVVSYWASGPATVTINSTTAVAVTTTGTTTNGFTYYEHLLPVGTHQVDLTATSINIDELRLYPKDAQMQTQTYDPLTGITSQVSPANVSQYYTYDGLQRLITIKDINGNIKQNYGYNYGAGITATAAAQTLFYNAAQQQSFTKQGCPAGSTPTAVTYNIPYGKYAASTQTAADALATADMAANGQAYANANGQCLYYNDTAYHGFYFKNDCPPDQGTGSAVNYVVAVGTVSSTISVADANTKAHAQVAANGQAYANEWGTCSCGAEGQKIVNGTCETGTKIYTSSTYSGGHYICVYHYVFSDGSVSQDYTINSPTNCVNN